MRCTAGPFFVLGHLCKRDLLRLLRLPRVAGRAARRCDGFDAFNREGRLTRHYRHGLNTSIARGRVHCVDEHSKSPGRGRSHSSKSPGCVGPVGAHEAGDSRAASNFYPGPNDFYLQPGFSGEARRLPKTRKKCLIRLGKMAIMHK